MTTRMIAVIIIVLSISIPVKAADYGVYLKQIRYSNKIRAEVIFENKSGNTVKNVSIQVALTDKEGEIIAMEERMFMGPIPNGGYKSEEFFWDGTTQADYKKLHHYKPAITWIE